MLSDEEFEPIGKALENRGEQIKEYRRVHQCSLDEALKHSSVDALDHYERISGIRLAHPDELYWVQLSRYGRPCPHCGKPFRTPRAKLCAECGFTLPKWTALEEGEAPYFAFSATLRIYGEGLDLNEITRALRLAPTRAHRKGERRSGGAIHRYDTWHYSTDLPEGASFDAHLRLMLTCKRFGRPCRRRATSCDQSRRNTQSMFSVAIPATATAPDSCSNPSHWRSSPRSGFLSTFQL